MLKSIGRSVASADLPQVSWVIFWNAAGLWGLEAYLKTLPLNLAINLGSLAFLAVTGFLITFLIGRYYGPTHLGNFNVIFALFVFLSQLGSFGLQYSSLRYASLYSDTAERSDILRSAIFIAVAAASIAVVVGLIFAPFIVWVFKFESVGPWLVVLPGLWCFSLNKAMLAFINGIGAMRSFAALQSCRYILLTISLFGFIEYDLPGEWLCVVLTLSEVALMPLLIARLGTYFVAKGSHRHTDRHWRGLHLRFGAVAMASGIMTELNTRVDTLLVAIMLGSYQAGIYTIAILMADGLGQVIPVVRNVINPMLTPMVEERNQAALFRLVRNIGLVSTAIMISGGAFLVCVFPYLDRWLLKSAFSDAFEPLIILVFGQVVSAPLMIFAMILNQGGRPAIFSLFMTILLALNVSFNVIGISMWGLIGAAAGTAAAYLVGVFVLNMLCIRTFGLRLIG